MAVHLGNRLDVELGSEVDLRADLEVHLLEHHQRGRFDGILETEHYLHNPTAVGAVLRYIVTCRGQWVALLVFASAAFHIKARDRWLEWSPREVPRRRHLLAQNTRFLLRVPAQKYPNLASRILALVQQRIQADWEKAFGHPLLALESFIDPQRFRGTCYKAAGWERLGPTQGFQRTYKDFYTDTVHPKELWVRALSPEALAQLRAAELPESLRLDKPAPPPPCPVVTAQLTSLWFHFREGITDPRKPQGIRHPLPTLLTIGALAIASGCHGPEAIAEFAQSLNHYQRRRLRCRPRTGHSGQFEVPSEDTFRRQLEAVPSESLVRSLVAWMKVQDPSAIQWLHFDGKVLKNTDPAPPWDPPIKAAVLPTEIPAEAQKPHAHAALNLINFMTTDQRLIDQIAVPANTNEEAAAAAHLPKMDLVGVRVTADAAHVTKANLQQLTCHNGADYVLRLKRNQPHAYAKAEQLFQGNFPPFEDGGGLRARPAHDLSNLPSADRSGNVGVGRGSPNPEGGNPHPTPPPRSSL